MQQSRFIALVSNGKRLREVATAAEDSEDAGLIQYSKTLDSLESKQANLKTSFQQFYMSALNGNFFKGLIDGLTTVLEGFNKLSKPTAILNAVSIIQGLKIIGQLFVNAFSSAFGQIRTNFKQLMEDVVTTTRTKAKESGQAVVQETEAGIAEQQTIQNATVADTDTLEQKQPSAPSQWLSSHKNQIVIAGYALSSMLSTAGALTASKNQTAGAWLSGAGNGLNAGMNAFMLASAIPGLQGPGAAGIGVAVGLITGIISAISSLPTELEAAKEKAQQSAKKYEEKNLARAESKQRVSTLSEGIEKLKELTKNKYDSEDARKEWLDTNNSLFEALPDLTATFDSAGNAIIDITAAEEALAAARQKTAKETVEAAEAELENIQDDLAVARAEKKEIDEAGFSLLSSSLAFGGEITSVDRDESSEVFWSEAQKRDYGLPAEGDYGSFFAGNIVMANLIQHHNLFDLNDLATVQFLLDNLNNSDEKGIYTALREGLFNGTIKANSTEDMNELVDFITGGSYKSLSEWKGASNKKQQEIKQYTTKENTVDTKVFSSKVTSLVTDQIVEKSESGKAYEELTNADILINKFLQARASEVEDLSQFDLATEFEEKNAQIASLRQTLRNLGSVDDFNELTQLVEEGKLTAAEYQQNLLKLFKVPDVESLKNIDGLDIYTEEYYKVIEANRDNVLNALKSHYKTQNQATQEYDIDGKDKNVQSALIALSYTIPEAFSANIIKYAKTLQEQVEAGTTSETHRGDLLLKQKELWTAAAAITDSVLQGQVRTILSEAEYDSTIGKMEAIEKLKDLGQTNLISIVNDIDTGAENLITAFDSLSTKMSSSLDKIGDVLTDAVDGLSLEDTIKAAKKAGLNLATDFQMIGDKFYVNEGAAQERVNSSQIESAQNTLAALQKKNQKEQRLFTSGAELTAEETNQRNRLKEVYQDSAKQWINDIYLTANRTLEEQSILDSLGIDSYIESQTDLGAKLDDLILAYLQSLNNGLIAAGEKYLNHKLAEQQAIRIDGLIKNISSSLGGLTDSIEGTLSAADLLELQDRYGLTGKGAILTSKGYTLGEQDQRDLTAAQYRNVYDSFGTLGVGEFGKQLWEAWRDAEEPLFKSYREVEDAAKAAELAAEDMGERTDEAAQSAWDYADALRAAASAAMLSEDAYEFTFMEQDATKGLTKNFDSFVSQIDTVQEAFKSLKAQGKDGYIGYQDFYNMMDFLNASIQNFESRGEDLPASLSSLQSIFKRTGEGYEDFVNAVVANTDKWGKVNIEGIAAQMGISVDTAMSMMSEGMVEGLKQVARDQIKYLSGLEQMLKAMQALAEVGDIKFSLDFEFEAGDGSTQKRTLENLQDLKTVWEEICSLPDDKIAKARFDFVSLINNEFLPDANSGQKFIKGIDAVGKNLGVDQLFNSLFPGGEITVDNADIFANAASYAQQLSNLSTEAAQGMADYIQRAMEANGIKFEDKDGQKRVVDGQTAAIQKFFEGFFADPEQVQAALNSAANVEQYAEMLKVGNYEATFTIGDTNFTLQSDGTTITYDGDLPSKSDIEAAITEKYGSILKQGEVFDVKIGEGNTISYSVVSQVDKWKQDLADGTQEAINILDNATLSLDSSKQLVLHADSSEIDEALAKLSQLTGKDVTINTNNQLQFTELRSAESYLNQISATLSTLSTDGIKFSADTSEVKTAIDTILGWIEDLKAAAKIEIQTSVSGEVPTPENPSTTTVPEKTGASLTPRAIIASAGMSDVGQPQTVPVTVEADTSSAQQEIQQSFSKTPIDVPVEIAQADNDAAYQFISSYENIITQVLNASSDAQLNLSQMFNFGNIDISGLQQISTSINEIAASLQQLSGSHTSIDQIGQSAQQAESKIDGLVGELQALAGRLKEISGSVSFDLDTDGISLLSNALVSLNEQGTSTITFTANGDEVKKVAEAVKGYIASVDTSHSTTFRASAGNVKSVVDQVQKLIASIKTNIPISFSGSVRISKSGGKPPLAPSGAGSNVDLPLYTGNVDGKALVNGQTYGAAVAGKTLVGELGPELAVYDNKYHLLGKDGAEFVDLPSDAIVFNHLQTQGIIDGKVDKIRGTQLNAAYQHATMYTGNALVEGNAFAGGAGIGAALAAVRRAKSVWQGLLNSLSAADLMSGGGGGGGGGGGKNASLKPYIADLQEWYNLSRQIVDLENRINTLVAQRNNLSKGFDQGAAYLRNLKESQALLEDQLNTQRDLYRYQQDELKRQADAINDSSNWISKFYKVGADGVLQYVEGNETNGGKGALEVLQELNDMGNNPERYTIKDQIAWIEEVTNGQFKRGFTWEEGQTEDENGKTVGNGEYTKKEWTDEEYVQEFFSTLQEPIDDYDGLRDSVQETEEKLESLAEEIQKVNDEIRDNEIEVSQMIYDAIVQVKEKVIKDLKESNKLITDANKAYADSIQDAITKEKNQYSNNQNIAERETLQRQLSLLRRSGGSASEIQNLEKTISEKLKDEYFQKQEDALEVIKDANTKQTELMEQQVQLLQDTLDYEKENGVLWTKVYEIMGEGNAFMLDFLSGAGADSFLEKANLEQKKMLEEWAFKIGLYSENERSTMLSNKYAEPAFDTLKANTSDTSKWKEGYKDVYDSVDAATRTGWDRDYLDTYNSYMLKNTNGQSSNEQIVAAQKEASRLAEQTFFEHIAQEKKRRDDNEKAKNQTNSNSGGSSGGSSGGNSSSSKSGGGGTSYTWKNTITGEKGVASSKKAAEAAIDKSYQNVYVGAGANAAAGAKYLEEKRKASKAAIKKNTTKTKYAAGGYNTTTGLAWLDGTPEAPEYILNAKQTRGLEQLVSFTQKNPDFVNVLKAHYDSFAGNLASQNYTTSNSNSINISDGAIQISVAKLNDSYDIEDISNDIMDRMYSIAAKSSSRSVSRR